MRTMTRLIRCAAVFGFVLAALAGTAGASYHTFRFAEIYSNPSGTIQFVEMHEAFGADFQNLEHFAPDIFSTSHDLTLTDLPGTHTANSFFLLGTAGYNALTGAPKADYLIPDHFFNPAGDTLQYGRATGPNGVVDTITFGPVPADPSEALQRTGTSGNNFTAGPAIANTFSNGGNFAVPEPASGVLCVVILGLLTRRGRL